LTPGSGLIQDAHELTAGLLEEIGRACQQAGASLIGHVKCHVRAEAQAGGERRFHANLTSMRSGARVAGEEAGPAASLQLDLVVLVYGLERHQLERAVTGALDDVARRAGLTWSREPARDRGEHGSHSHEGHH
jgi:hypothetical protein